MSTVIKRGTLIERSDQINRSLLERRYWISMLAGNENDLRKIGFASNICYAILPARSASLYLVAMKDEPAITNSRAILFEQLCNMPANIIFSFASAANVDIHTSQAK